MSQTPETNDIALVHLKSPMEMTEFVQVWGKFFCHCHFCRHHYRCYAAFAIIVENTLRISLPLRSGYSPDQRGGAWGRLYHSWLGHAFSRISYSWQVRCHHSRHELNNFIARHQRLKDIKASVKKRQYRQKPSSGCCKSPRPPWSTAPTAWTSSLHVRLKDARLLRWIWHWLWWYIYIMMQCLSVCNEKWALS